MSYIPDGLDSSFFCTSEGCRYPGDRHSDIPTRSTCCNCGRVNGYIRWQIGQVNQLMKSGMDRRDAVREVVRRCREGVQQ